MTNMKGSEVKMCPRCNREGVGRRPFPPCDVYMGKHDEIEFDTNIDTYIYYIFTGEI